MRSSNRTSRWVIAIAAIAVVLFVVGTTGIAPAQTLAGQQAAMNMQNTLSGGYVPSPSQYMGQPPVGTPPGGFNAAAQFPPGPPPVGVQPAQPAPPPVKKILVLTGEKVTCHVMKTVLEDIHYEYRPESEKDEYYDDGTHGDLLEDDNIYTNFGERDDVLSPEANRLKVVYMRMMSLVEEMNPIEFFRIPVATEEPLSRLPRMSDEERDRDETYLREWHQRFLALYRQEPDDPMSDFWPIFVPSPPRPPDTPSPPEDDFSPGAYALDDYIRRTVDGLTAPALDPGPGSGPGGGDYYDRYDDEGYGGGDRWSQARRDAASYGTYQGSSYYRR